MRLKSLMIGMMVAGCAVVASAAPINTGSAPWTVVSGPSGSGCTTGATAATLSATPSPWLTGTYIGCTSNDGNTALAGTYVFQINIGALVPSSGNLSFQYSADNSISWSITGGTLAGATTCAGPDCFSPGAGSPRSVTGTFTSGSILTATIVNLGPSASPVGLMVVGSTGDVIPEPSTYAMLGLGISALAIAKLRRR